MLLDEPFSSLDAGLRVQLRDEVHRLFKAVGVTTVLVTHDQHEALRFGDRVGVMQAGGSSRSTRRPSCTGRRPRPGWRVSWGRPTSWPATRTG